jgi:hypothetical protein
MIQGVLMYPSPGTGREGAGGWVHSIFILKKMNKVTPQPVRPQIQSATQSILLVFDRNSRLMQTQVEKPIFLHGYFAYSRRIKGTGQLIFHWADKLQVNILFIERLTEDIWKRLSMALFLYRKNPYNLR